MAAMPTDEQIDAAKPIDGGGPIVYAPPLQSLLGTAAPTVRDLALLLLYPFVVWGSDELRRRLLRRSAEPRAYKARMIHTGA